MKMCTACGATKPLTEFYAGKSRCKVCVRARVNQYRIDNPDIIQARKRDYYQRNKVAIRAKNDAWEEANGGAAAQTAAWRRRYPDRAHVLNNNNRCSRLGVPGRITGDEWAAIKARHGHLCARCGQLARLTIDHVVPLMSGGPNIASNVQPLCRSCNVAKGNTERS